MAIQKIQMIPPGYTDVLHPESETDMIICKDGTTLTNTIDGVSTFQTAGGTATAITLTGVTFNNGLAKTFIASANNNGSATTVNTKPLYKPGGVIAPTLTSGKAYTIWYSLSSNCFFIRASAEGTVGVANVLAGQTFSNETDTGLVGTMVNRAGDTASLSNSISGTTLKLLASAGYRDGVDDNVTITDANFVASNIVGGKSIFGLTGTLDGDYVFKQCTATPTQYMGGQVVCSNDDSIFLLNKQSSNSYVSKYTKDGVFVAQTGVIGSSSITDINLRPDYYNQTLYVGYYSEEKSYKMSDLTLTNSRVYNYQSFMSGSSSGQTKYVEDAVDGYVYTVNYNSSTGALTLKSFNPAGGMVLNATYPMSSGSTALVPVSVAVTNSQIFMSTYQDYVYAFSKSTGAYIGSVIPTGNVYNNIRHILGNGKNTFVTYMGDCQILFINNDLSKELQTKYAQGGNMLNNGWTVLGANNATDSVTDTKIGLYLVSPTKVIYNLLHPQCSYGVWDRFIYGEQSDGTLVCVTNILGNTAKKIVKIKPLGLY